MIISIATMIIIDLYFPSLSQSLDIAIEPGPEDEKSLLVVEEKDKICKERMKGWRIR
jgi:hypothetical protein